MKQIHSSIIASLLVFLASLVLKTMSLLLFGLLTGYSGCGGTTFRLVRLLYCIVAHNVWNCAIKFCTIATQCGMHISVFPCTVISSAEETPKLRGSPRLTLAGLLVSGQVPLKCLYNPTPLTLELGNLTMLISCWVSLFVMFVVFTPGREAPITLITVEWLLFLPSVSGCVCLQ